MFGGVPGIDKERPSVNYQEDTKSDETCLSPPAKRNSSLNATPNGKLKSDVIDIAP